MDKNKIFSKCNIKLDTDNYKEDRTVCRSCYKRKKRKSNNFSLHNQKSKALITITMTIEPQTSSNDVLEFPEIKKSRFLRSAGT